MAIESQLPKFMTAVLEAPCKPMTSFPSAVGSSPGNRAKRGRSGASSADVNIPQNNLFHRECTPDII